MKFTYIDNGFYQVSRADAILLAEGKLPKYGYMKKCKAPEGFESESGYVWLQRTQHWGETVWSIHKC